MDTMKAKLLPLVSIVLSFAVPAEAYIDPGTGDLIYQLLIAAVLVILFTARHWVPPIFRRFSRIFKR